MVIRNSVRYLMNRLMFGSECIYHEENCIIDHVTKRATDVNRIEKKSVLKLILSSIEFMVTQCQVVIIYSILLWKNINRGKRLIMKENLIDVVVYSGKLMCLIRFDIEIRIGDSRRTRRQERWREELGGCEAHRGSRGVRHLAAPPSLNSAWRKSQKTVRSQKICSMV